MLASGVAVNEMNRALDTPLHFAVRAGKPACAYLLLAAGANPYPPNRAGATPHLLARRYPPGEVQQELVFLLERPGVVREGLRYAVQRGEANMTRLLLEVGLDPNAVDAQGSVPMHDAALRGNVAVVDVLLASGAAVEVFDRDGFLPLHLAALSGKAEVIGVLLAHGAKVSARTRETQETALHIAAAWGRVDAVRVLLAAGADRLVKDSRGRTPLDRAAESGFGEATLLLRAPK
jgi:ankyrin repeat protein